MIKCKFPNFKAFSKKSEETNGFKNNTKNIKIIVIALLIMLMIISVFFMFKKNDEESLDMSSMRFLNLDSISVTDNHKIYEIKNNNVMYDGKPLVQIGNYKKNILTKIDEFLFYQDQEGLVKYDIENDIVHKLYYDTMDYAVAGINYIYYITDDSLIKLNSEGFSEIVEHKVSSKIAFVFENRFYYIQKNEVNYIDLVTDEKHFVMQLDKEPTNYAEENSVQTDGKYLIMFEDETIVIDLINDNGGELND